MIVIFGASGFAFECFEVLRTNGIDSSEINFFDDVSEILPPLVDEFGLTVYRNVDELKNAFPYGFDAIIGTGNPNVRKLLFEKIEMAGGKNTTLISKDARIGYLGNKIGIGGSIMTGVIITSNCKINNGVLLNLGVTVGHDSYIGAFSEVCPGANISGKCRIGKSVFIGTGAILLPGIEIGDGAVIAAGSVVTKNVAPNTMVAGNPAVWKKNI